MEGANKIESNNYMLKAITDNNTYPYILKNSAKKHAWLFSGVF